MYIHNEVMKHKDFETYYRCNQNHVFVNQGMNLFRKLGKECVFCKKFQDQCPDISTAPLLSVIEKRTTDTVIYGVNRLDCKIGIPSVILIDQGSGIVKAFNKAEVNTKDIDLVLFEENKIRLKTCPVSGLNINRLAERKIRPVSESLESAGILKMKLHVTEFQSVSKLI